MIIEINNTPHAVKLVDSRSPSSRNASTLYKIRYTNLKTGQKLDESYKGDDFLKEADCIRVKVQYSYSDGESYVFMDSEDYSQIHAQQGSSATARTKTTVLPTGMEVQRPEYLETGEIIKINTSTGKYMSRA